MKSATFRNSYREHSGILIKKYRNFWGAYVFVINEDQTKYKIRVGKGLFDEVRQGSQITVGERNGKLINIRVAFGEAQAASNLDIPSWDDIIEYMQDKGLSGFVDAVVHVLSSKDLSKRILILQSESGYYTVLYEEIRVYTPDEWAHFCNDPDRYPAWWEPVYSSSLNTASFYGTVEEAMQAIKNSYEYKMYFA